MSGEWEKAVEKYSEEVGMKNRDVVKINPVTMPNFEEKVHTSNHKLLPSLSTYSTRKQVKVRAPMANGDGKVIFFLYISIF